LLVCPTDRVSAEVIEQLPDSIVAIATFSVGYDHVDLAAATKRGITVTNTPDVLTDATADMAMLLLLGAARQARAGEAMVREATWTAWAPTELLGTEVSGKRLGILGMGRIGRAVAKRARGFDMEIHYQDVVRSPDDEAAGAQYHETVESLLGVSSFLTIHCPLMSETRHLLNAERIALLPDGAVVVNAARGDIVDDEALIAAVESGKVSAIGLDVYEGEPNLNPAYRTLENSFLMPHLGSATVETRDAMGFTALDNLDAVFAGDPPPNKVN
jgi:glyoxylate reductase